VAWVRVHLRALLALGAAISVGAFLSVASHELNWTDATTFVVGGAMMFMLALFGVPLILLANDGVEASAAISSTQRSAYGRAPHDYPNEPSISDAVLAQASYEPTSDPLSPRSITYYGEDLTIWSINEVMSAERMGGDIHRNIDLHEGRLIYTMDFWSEPAEIGVVDELRLIDRAEYENDLPLSAAANGR
jgi:hypothetical protein